MTEKQNPASIIINFKEKNDNSFLDVEVTGTPQNVEDAIYALTAFLADNVKEEYREKLGIKISKQVKTIISNYTKETKSKI